MDIKKIVEDVIKDFEYRPELEMEVHSDEGSYHVIFETTYDLVGDALVEGIKPFESELEPWQVYCLCNQCLHGMEVHNLLFDVNSASKDELKKLVRDEIYCEQENIFKETQGLNIDTSFSYKPEHLKKIHELSDQIFTEAKNVKILGEAKSIDADGLLAEMVSLEKELESFKHPYWNPQTNLHYYDMKILASELDVDVINDLSSSGSCRLIEAVKEYVALKSSSIHHGDEVSDKERQEVERLQELEEWLKEQEKKSQEEIDWESIRIVRNGRHDGLESVRNVSVTAYLVGCWVDSWKKGETVMLNIYLNEEAVPDGVDIDYYSEYVFRNRGPIKFDKKMCDIVYKIDGAKFIDGNVFKDKFGNTISANDLSTGCKTALNVYMDPDRVHCCWECGRNALREICLLDRGNILSLYAPPYLDIDTSANIMLHKNKKQRLVHSYNEAIDNWMNP